MKNYFDLKDQVAIVTGCSTGLGVQMAKALARQGCNIVAVARRQNLIEEVAADLAKEYGVDTIELHSDAINENDVVLLHDDLLATGGTMNACYELVKSMNPKQIYINFIVELEALEGRRNLPADCEITSLLKY